jgi:hypothetical protein
MKFGAQSCTKVHISLGRINSFALLAGDAGAVQASAMVHWPRLQDFSGNPTSISSDFSLTVRYELCFVRAPVSSTSRMQAAPNSPPQLARLHCVWSDERRRKIVAAIMGLRPQY